MERVEREGQGEAWGGGGGGRRLTHRVVARVEPEGQRVACNHVQHVLVGLCDQSTHTQPCIATVVVGVQEVLLELGLVVEEACRVVRKTVHTVTADMHVSHQVDDLVKDILRDGLRHGLAVAQVHIAAVLWL